MYARYATTLTILLAMSTTGWAQERGGLRGSKTIFGEWFQPGAPAGEETPLASDRPDFTESSTKGLRIKDCLDSGEFQPQRLHYRFSQQNQRRKMTPPKSPLKKHGSDIGASVSDIRMSLE